MSSSNSSSNSSSFSSNVPNEIISTPTRTSTQDSRPHFRVAHSTTNHVILTKCIEGSSSSSSSSSPLTIQREERSKRKHPKEGEVIHPKRVNHVPEVVDVDSSHMNNLELLYFKWTGESEATTKLKRLHSLSECAITVAMFVLAAKSLIFSNGSMITLWSTIHEWLRMKRRILNADISVSSYQAVDIRWRYTLDKFIHALASTAPDYFREPSPVSEWLEAEIGIDKWNPQLERLPCSYCHKPWFKPVQVPCCKRGICIQCLLITNAKSWYGKVDLFGSASITSLKVMCPREECKTIFSWEELRKVEPQSLSSGSLVPLPPSSNSTTNIFSSSMHLNEANGKLKSIVEWVTDQIRVSNVLLIIVAEPGDLQIRLPHYLARSCSQINTHGGLGTFVKNCRSVDTHLPHVGILTSHLVVDYAMKHPDLSHSLMIADVFFEAKEQASLQFLQETLRAKHLLHSRSAIVFGDSMEPGMSLFLWAKELANPSFVNPSHSTVGRLIRNYKSVTSLSVCYNVSVQQYQVTFERLEHKGEEADPTSQIHPLMRPIQPFTYRPHHFLPHGLAFLASFTEADLLQFYQYQSSV
ncbi:MAG: hypothetical protein Sylvanvirus35_2 [Sylvanvirus sp.]|uniref:Uncharacterized protein n=1 Tax=Sylvanvirus sp. TaxID=2487774 RepID=A0A3G5AJX3_9VIRU|nr:MAG: hypothetical protein Sylvanvirus35_2 [Sylvanvirus sp.]